MTTDEHVARGAEPAILGPYLAKVFEDDAWLDVDVDLIGGGKSNLTYLATAGDKEVVLRRPPLGHVLPTAHDMVREFTVLGALGPTVVPVPHVLHLCTDSEVLGAPFYVMERVTGHIVRETMPPGYAETEAERARIGEGLIRTLVDLHAVDWRAVGLEDFGHPDGFLARQIRRWRQQWERSETRPLPAMNELMDVLEKQVPASPDPTIVHGDFRLDNTVLDPEEPGRIAGVLDWEMSTLGDPLADVGLLLVYWSDSYDNESLKAGFGKVISMPGFPTRAEIVERYAELSGRDLSNIHWYRAFGYMKIAVVLEGIHARFLQGKTVGAGFESVGAMVEPLALVGAHVLQSKDLGPL